MICDGSDQPPAAAKSDGAALHARCPACDAWFILQAGETLPIHAPGEGDDPSQGGSAEIPWPPADAWEGEAAEEDDAPQPMPSIEDLQAILDAPDDPNAPPRQTPPKLRVTLGELERVLTNGGDDDGDAEDTWDEPSEQDEAPLLDLDRAHKTFYPTPAPRAAWVQAGRWLARGLLALLGVLIVGGVVLLAYLAAGPWGI